MGTLSTESQALHKEKHRIQDWVNTFGFRDTGGTGILLHWAAAAPSEKGCHCCISAFENLHGIQSAPCLSRSCLHLPQKLVMDELAKTTAENNSSAQ